LIISNDEQNYVDKLHASPNNYLSELALVAKEDGKLVGHVLLTEPT